METSEEIMLKLLDLREDIDKNYSRMYNETRTDLANDGLTDDEIAYILRKIEADFFLVSTRLDAAIERQRKIMGLDG